MKGYFKIVSFKTFDGKIFEDENDAIKHSENVLHKELSKFFNDCGFSASEKFKIESILMSNKLHIYNLLNNFNCNNDENE